MSKEKLTTVGIYEEDRDALKEIADLESRSMTQQLRHWIRQYKISKERHA